MTTRIDAELIKRLSVFYHMPKKIDSPEKPLTQAKPATSPELKVNNDNKDNNEEVVKPRIRIKIRAYDHKIVDQSVRTIAETVERSGAKIVGPVPLPTEKARYTVIKSPFVHKDSREQYEMRTHKRLIDIIEPTAKTVESLQSLNLPAGVDVEIKM